MAKPHIRLRAGMSSHHGASTYERDVAGWHTSRTSADAEILPELDQLVGRSRDIDRNNGVAESGFRTKSDYVLGSGLRLNPRPDYKALGRTKEWADENSAKWRALWEGYYWTTACDASDALTGDAISKQALYVRQLNGECLGLPLWIPERGDGWATKMQAIESDRLSNPNYAPDTDTLRGGIKLGKYGVREGYWFQKSHPGDRFNGLLGAAGEWEFVPRKTEFGRLRVVHVFDAKRPGQTRGKPILASILSQFKNLDRYQGAELHAAVANALVAMTIETPSSHDEVMEWFKGDVDNYLGWRQKHAVSLKSGNILTLMPGDKASGFLPARPNEAFEAFVVILFRQIALAFDMPYEVLMKDWSRLNYVTLRAALLDMYRAVTRERDEFSSGWLDPWYALWFEEAVHAGKIDAPDFYENRVAYLRCRWIGPGRGALDPVKEAQGSAARMDNHTSTLEDECAMEGKDWTEVLEQRATEYQRMRELGLPDHSAVRAANPPQTVDSDGNPTGGTPPESNSAEREKATANAR